MDGGAAKDRAQTLLVFDPAEGTRRLPAAQGQRVVPPPGLAHRRIAGLDDLAPTGAGIDEARLRVTYFAALCLLTGDDPRDGHRHRELIWLGRRLRLLALVADTPAGWHHARTLSALGALHGACRLPIDAAALTAVLHMLRSTARLDQPAAAHDRRACDDSPAGTDPGGRLVGTSPAMAEVRRHIARYAGADLPVLIAGESGTGKDLVAQEIHRASARAAAAFLPINCATLSPTLAGAELFGHERGAFTDAREARAGRFEQAHGGTLFLDEVAELGADIQAQLLRVLEDGVVYRLGTTRPRRVDVRVIAASNTDLDAAVAAGRFRFDLLQRLDVLRLTMPALRRRGGDILALARHFLAADAARIGQPKAWLSPAAERQLLAYGWPGNVRELQNVVRRAVTMTGGGEIAAPVPGLPRPRPDACTRPATLAAARSALDRRLMAAALRRHQGHVSDAAQSLGISRPGFYRLLKRHGLTPESLLTEEAPADDPSP
ncbi:hypothetical protein CCR85_06115 [Rhodothalassium salexigens]|uniref:sigma-54 interaction domain-containing protein n=1 Tax=Rhodothalassium salexigens TaxID=1086 RepID=UPI001913B37C|nr:sigma-54 dependent transcriptional regulator [Rhodothalassium salexigens]MBK5911065.1 hypothetical protein [Rhodothalassium salexigens]